MKTSIRAGIALGMSLALSVLGGCTAEAPDEEAGSTDSAISGSAGNCTAHQMKSLGRATVFYKFNKAGKEYDVFSPGAVNHGEALPDVIFREYLNVTGFLAAYDKTKKFSARVMPELEAVGILAKGAYGSACELKTGNTCPKESATSFDFQEGGRTWRYTITKTPDEIVTAVRKQVAVLRGSYHDCSDTSYPVKIVVGGHSPANHPGLLCQQSSDLLGPTLTGASLPADLADCNGTTPGE